ncbi:hypothetical protein GCM10009613_55140 [Pseudonocardia kongjuensis]|uniref:4Fe-4S Wbl-type domain-containing protein n=1 Tax=Pseudonocardia kongjuensis TaxID=102227 RepID=A0ABN1YBS6_9PSEU
MVSSLREIRGPDLPGAACADLAPAFDLHVAGESAEDRAARLAMAARVCAGCLVVAACRSAVGAAEDGTVAGVWAGEVVEPKRRRPGTLEAS